MDSEKDGNVAENDSNNKRGWDDVTRSSAGSIIGTGGSKKSKEKKQCAWMRRPLILWVVRYSVELILFFVTFQMMT